MRCHDNCTCSQKSDSADYLCSHTHRICSHTHRISRLTNLIYVLIHKHHHAGADADQHIGAQSCRAIFHPPLDSKYSPKENRSQNTDLYSGYGQFMCFNLSSTRRNDFHGHCRMSEKKPLPSHSDVSALFTLQPFSQRPRTFYLTLPSQRYPRPHLKP